MPRFEAKLSQSLGVGLGGAGGALAAGFARGSRRGGGAGVEGGCGSGGGAAPSARAKSSQLDLFSGFSILKMRPTGLPAANTLCRCSCQFTISFLSIGLSGVRG
jgi:hypothetical protein